MYSIHEQEYSRRSRGHTDEVPGADRVLLAGEPVEHLDVDAVGVLGVGEVLGGEARLGAARGGVADQDGLEVVLRDVDGQARRGQPVVALAVGTLVLRAAVRARPRDCALTAIPGLLLALGTFAFGEATRTGLLSVVSVIATLNPVITVGLAFGVLHERPSRIQLAGTILALAGIALLAAG